MMLAILLLYAGKKSFFSDEVDQIGILVSCGSLREVLALYAGMGHEVAPPLFAAVAWLWYRLMPLSQAWLQTLPAIAACAGIFFVGCSGRIFGGGRTAVLSALFACALPAMATTVGTQFRQYAFVFLFASLTVYAYLLRTRQQGRERIGTIIFYGVVMAGLPYSHYLSVFVCFFLFLLDVRLFLQKKLRFRCFLSYGVGAALFLPWAITILRSVMRISSFWVPVPRLLDILDALYFLTDVFSLRFFLYVGGLCVAVVALFRRQSDKKERDDRSLPFAFAVAAPVMIGLLYVYSRFFSDGISLFLPRYFICTLPMVILTAALFCDRLFCLLLRDRAVDPRAVSMSFLLICAVLFGISAWRNVQQNADEVLEPYREASDWLCEQPDIYDADVAVITAGESRYVTAGLETLYITRAGQRPPLTVFDRVRPFTEADAARYKTAYVLQIHAALPPESEETLLAHYALQEDAQDGLQWNVRRYVRTGG